MYQNTTSRCFGREFSLIGAAGWRFSPMVAMGFAAATATGRTTTATGRIATMVMTTISHFDKISSENEGYQMDHALKGECSVEQLLYITAPELIAIGRAQ
jgi:hypothetical protein